jgi:hypothetical protein
LAASMRMALMRFNRNARAEGSRLGLLMLVLARIGRADECLVDNCPLGLVVALDILHHPALMDITLSNEEPAAVQRDGLQIGGVPWPKKCPFVLEAAQVPICRVKFDGPNGSWGNGAFAGQDLEEGKTAAVYVGLHYSLDTGLSVDELALGNHNATIFNESKPKAGGIASGRWRGCFLQCKNNCRRSQSRAKTNRLLERR